MKKNQTHNSIFERREGKRERKKEKEKDRERKKKEKRKRKNTVYSVNYVQTAMPKGSAGQ